MHCWPEQIAKSSIFSKKQIFKNWCGFGPGTPPKRQQVHCPLINVMLVNDSSYNFVKPGRPGWHLASLKSPSCALTGHNMRKIRKLTTDRTNFASHPLSWLAIFGWADGPVAQGRYFHRQWQIIALCPGSSEVISFSWVIHTHKLMTIVNTSSPALRCAYILFLNKDSDHLGLRSKLILCKVQEKRFV